MNIQSEYFLIQMPSSELCTIYSLNLESLEEASKELMRTPYAWFYLSLVIRKFINYGL